jgi:hypothetical protein
MFLLREFKSFNTNTANQDTANGDLPGSPGNLGGYTTPVHVLQDFPIPKSDEGRAMLQIVHDVGTGWQSFISVPDFLLPVILQQLFYELTNSGCHVIVDDITYITEPFLKDGHSSKSS